MILDPVDPDVDWVASPGGVAVGERDAGTLADEDDGSGAAGDDSVCDAGDVPEVVVLSDRSVSGVDVGELLFAGEDG